MSIKERFHFTLDLETMSTAANAAIVSIGCCRFDPLTDGNPVRETFYRIVRLESCVNLGLHLDTGTIMWWLEQNAEARARLTLKKGTVSLSEALLAFNDWIIDVGRSNGFSDGFKLYDDSVTLWGNGAAFDNTIIRSAYRAAGVKFIIPHWMDRDCRTVMDLLPHEDVLALKATYGTVLAHDALEDAKGQARYVSEALRQLKLV